MAMKRYAILILVAAAACSPNYQTGKTQCSTSKQCPGGFTCVDDGTSATHYCFETKSIGCAAGNGFYCSQSKTCWPTPGVCSTVTTCPAGTKRAGANLICGSAGYHADCGGDACVANGVVADASPIGGAGGAIGADGPTAKGGTGGTTLIIGPDGAAGTGGSKDAALDGIGGIVGTGGIRDAAAEGIGGIVGTGGIRDAAAEGIGGIVGTGGIRDAAAEGLPGTGGLYLTGGGTGRGGATGTGGIYLTGGATGRGGVSGTGGTTIGSTLCTGTPVTCDYNSYQSDCNNQYGCVWDSSTDTCSGTASSCSAYSSGSLCAYNGCSWGGTLTCSPTTMTAYCSNLITSSTTACTLCDYTSCCGQLVACLNDITCYDTGTSPLYRVWLDCFVGCCASTCSGTTTTP
jgi:hypothetical protein